MIFSNFETYQFADGLIEVIDIKNTVNILNEANSSFDRITMKAQSKTKRALRSHEIPFFISILGFIPNLNYEPNVEYSTEIKLIRTTIDKTHLQDGCLDGSELKGFIQFF